MFGSNTSERVDGDGSAGNSTSSAPIEFAFDGQRRLRASPPPTSAPTRQAPPRPQQQQQQQQQPPRYSAHDQMLTRSHSAPDARGGDFDRFYFPPHNERQQYQQQQYHHQQQQRTGPHALPSPPMSSPSTLVFGLASRRPHLDSAEGPGVGHAIHSTDTHISRHRHDDRHHHHSSNNNSNNMNNMNSMSGVEASNGGAGTDSSPHTGAGFPLFQQLQTGSRASPPANGSLVALLRDHRSPDAALLGHSALTASEMFGGLTSTRARSDSSVSSTSSASARASRELAVDSDAASTASPSPMATPPAGTSSTRQQQQQQLARASKSRASSAVGASSSARVSTADAAAGVSAKRSRYLREVDRRSIIHRIDRGEKQAALAKEYGVTRAAICHINKNRVEILTRSTRADVHAAARHPKRGLYNTSASSASAAAQAASRSALEQQAGVLEVQSQAMAVLMTTLRRRETRPRDFQRCADRALRLLLEEALARVSLRVVDVVTPSDSVCEGVVADKPSCAIALSADGFALLQAFRAMQPASPAGYVALATARDGAEPALQQLCVPTDLRAHDVFVLEATCASGAGACAAIQALLDLGADERAVRFVCLLAAAPAVAEIASRFPRVRVVAGAIDPEVADGGAIHPGIGNFSERYFNATVVTHSRHGADVDL